MTKEIPESYCSEIATKLRKVAEEIEESKVFGEINQNKNADCYNRVVSIHSIETEANIETPNYSIFFELYEKL